MARFSFRQRGTMEEYTRDLNLTSYSPRITLEGLMTGVDNVRHDVHLSTKFTEGARQHIFRLITRLGGVEDLAKDPPPSPSPKPGSRIYTPQNPASANSPRRRGAPDAEPPPPDFKRLLTDLHVTALNAAKLESNISIDVLSRLAVLKFLRSELGNQFSQVLERCLVRIKSIENPKFGELRNAAEMRQRFATLQVGKKPLLRKVAEELFTTLSDVERETLSKMRRSLFDDSSAEMYELFLNRLLFTVDGRDDYVNAGHYLMLGNFERDPDRFANLFAICRDFLRAIGVVAPDDDEAPDLLLSSPPNAEELFGAGNPDENTSQGKSQRVLLGMMVEALERANVMDYIIAFYEVVPLLAQYPMLNPQQLKNALISRSERRRVEIMLDEARMSDAPLQAALRRIENCRGHERARTAGRFFSDFARYNRDRLRMNAAISAMDMVNVIANDKLRQLSTINHTLYEFEVGEPIKSPEDRVIHHAVVKADVRDSTRLTRTLYDRGLNPASFFSLNFFEPVNGLLAKFGATKVFIEGDAVILAMLEHEREPEFAVSRACVLAKEMVTVVGGYNENSAAAGLPVLEVGLGVSYQDSSPMYLLDGDNRIMISDALNESDRLASCTKGARRFLSGVEGLFNVYTFQIVDDEETGGAPEDFLVRYNIGGIHISGGAFEKLRQEISLKLHEIELPTIWDTELVRLYSGMVPVGPGVFHELVIREGIVAHIDSQNFDLKAWTDMRYYEVCTHPTIYEYIQNELALGQLKPQPMM